MFKPSYKISPKIFLLRKLIGNLPEKSLLRAYLRLINSLIDYATFDLHLLSIDEYLVDAYSYFMSCLSFLEIKRLLFSKIKDFLHTVFESSELIYYILRLKVVLLPK